ncbi:DNA primase family protein [Solidesulfovibrio magneticus]|nr:phage/plasmid primase, P4 family [Solidesulfovibrio magneticus]
MPISQPEGVALPNAANVVNVFGNFNVGLTAPSQGLRPIFAYPLTDLGNAQKFYRVYNKFFMYDHESAQWVGWDNDKKRWLTGRLARQLMMRFVMKLVDELYRQAKSLRPLRTRNGEEVTPEEALAWAKATSQNSRKKAVLEMVRDLPKVRVAKAELDSDPYLLGVANGVLDLRTGTLIENRPELRITRYASAAYRPDAEAPIFQGFMRQICLGRQDLVDFLQEVFGYALSGLIKEHAFFILVGTGANGKSTLVEIFLYLLGEYGIGMPGHAFLKSNSRAIRNDIARWPGIRLGTIAEANDGMSFDESLLKRSVAGDVMTARFIGKEYFDFHPVAKFFLSVNTLPKITGADNGIYRRLVVIPFDGDFQATMDRDLPEKLKAEIDGILAWAVQGFLRWQARGHLVKPDCVVEACKAYRAEMDTVQSFLDECCILDPNVSTPLGVLYEAYKNWAKGAVVDPANLHLFGTLMGQKGFKKVKSGTWRWKGVALKAAPTVVKPSPFGMTTPPPSAVASASSFAGMPQ